ncbi:MAG: GIY-YIG nuclease family protein [Cyclobacteriaceae bacterium]
MWFVYFLQSIDQTFLYIGHTDNLERRLREHNEGLNRSTKHYAPFIITAYVAVRGEAKAVELEKYFKTGSGKAVLKNE